MTRMTRSSMLDEWEDYVRTARAKGLSEKAVIFIHTLKNALIPTVTIVGLQFGTILGGSVVIEMVFSWPGVGQLIYRPILTRDYLVVGRHSFAGGLFPLREPDRGFLVYLVEPEG